MRIVNKLSVVLLAIFLVACASKWNVPKLESFGEKSFALLCNDKSYLLYVSDTLNFALFDGLFVLIVSKKLENNVFKNTKFLPPNSKFDGIFISVLNMIKDNKKTDIIKNKNLVCEVKEI